MAIQAQLYSENIARGSPQDYLVDNAYDFKNLYFIAQQQKPRKQEDFLQFDQQSMDCLQSISAHIEKQRREIDRFVCLQNERLRITLQEQRKQQLALFLKKYETKIQFLLKQKEEEIAMASRRTMELEEYLKNIEIENQTWQRLAKENEAMVASLNSTIERLNEVDNSAEDAESCCGDEQELEQIENYSQKKLVCKCCNNRNSCVIMFPCKHLCSCKNCDAFLDSCPVCGTVKRASIEAIM